MRITTTLADHSAFAKSVKDAAEEVVNDKLDDLVRIMDDQWQSAVSDSGVGTSRAGTKKAEVTPLREAVRGMVVSNTFPMVVEYDIADDAREKVDALTRHNPPHLITGNPWLIFPDSRTGRKIKARQVGWRSSNESYVNHLRLDLVIRDAKRKFLRLFN